MMGVGRSFFRRSGPPARVQPAVKRAPQPSRPEWGAVAPPPPPTLHQPNPELLDRLKSVYVESTVAMETQENPFASERPQKRDKLPQDRSAKYEDEYLMARASPGYLTVQQVFEIFDKRREKTSEWTAETVANHYEINPQDAENLLKFYNSYRVLTPGKPDTPLKYHLLHR